MRDKIKGMEHLFCTLPKGASRALVVCVLLCTLSAPLAQAVSVELYSANTLKFPLDETSDEYTYKYNTGVKVKSKGFKAAWITGIGTTDFAELGQADFSGFEDMQLYRYGAEYSFVTRAVMAEVLVGTLCFSQGISRLKSPKFTVSSALSKPSPLTPGIAPALPTWTSSTTDLAAALTLEPAQKTSHLPTVQGAYLETGEMYWSAFKRFALPFVPGATISFSGGLFETGQDVDSEDAWFPAKRYFTEEKRLAMEGEMNANWAHLRVQAAAGIHESPFGGNYTWARVKDSLLLGPFSLHTFFYAADADLITVSESYPATRYQVGVNPQCTLWFGKKSLSAGVLAYAGFRQTVERLPEEYNEYKLKAALSFSSGVFKATANGTLTRSTQDDYYEGSANLRLTLRLLKFTSSSYFSWTAESETKNTYYFSQSLYPKKRLLTTLSATMTAVENEGEWDFTPALGLTLKGGGKHLKWTLKGAFQCSFEG